MSEREEKRFFFFFFFFFFFSSLLLGFVKNLSELADLILGRPGQEFQTGAPLVQEYAPRPSTESGSARLSIIASDASA